MAAAEHPRMKTAAAAAAAAALHADRVALGRFEPAKPPFRLLKKAAESAAAAPRMADNQFCAPPLPSGAAAAR